MDTSEPESPSSLAVRVAPAAESVAASVFELVRGSRDALDAESSVEVSVLVSEDVSLPEDAMMQNSSDRPTRLGLMLRQRRGKEITGKAGAIVQRPLIKHNEARKRQTIPKLHKRASRSKEGNGGGLDAISTRHQLA